MSQKALPLLLPLAGGGRYQGRKVAGAVASTRRCLVGGATGDWRKAIGGGRRCCFHQTLPGWLRYRCTNCGKATAA